MKAGDKVDVMTGESVETAKIIRFYANQGTVLVEMKCGKLVYLNYDNLGQKCFK